MNSVEAIKILALKSVKKPDADYNIRRICRWYSQRFHTPLHEVEDLPIDYILQHYFETEYELKDEEEIEAEIKNLFKTEAQLKEEALYADAEEADEAEFARFTAEQAKLEEQQAKEDGLSSIKPQDELPPMPMMPEPQLVPETRLESVDSLPHPEIKMVFVEDPNLFDEDTDSFGLVDQPEKD